MRMLVFGTCSTSANRAQDMRKGSSLRPLSSLLILLAGCGLPNQASWYDQLEADGPCHRANLLDGLDEDSTDEINDVFDCLNQGNLEPLATTIDALETPARDDQPAGFALARTLNTLPTEAIDLWGLLDVANDWFTNAESDISDWAHLGVELIYAQPYQDVVESGPSWRQSDVDNGVISPLISTMPFVAQAILDSEEDVLSEIDDMLKSERADKLATTFQEIIHAEEGLPSTLTDGLMRELGEALVATQYGANDRWPDSTGNSLNDLAQALLTLEGDALVLESILDPASNILGDSLIETKLRAVIGELYDDGHIAELPSQLLVLVSTDTSGGTVASGEDSAFVSLVRLLAEANQDLDCSVGIWGWGFDVSNPSVWFLQQLAALDPEDAASGVEIFGSTLSWSVFQELFGYVGSQCGLGSQFEDDLEAVQRLSDEEVDDLLVVMMRFLQAFEEGQSDRIPDLVNVVSALHTQSLSEPFEEILRDLLPLPITNSLIEGLPLLLEPGSYYSDAFDTSQAFDFEELWQLLEATADLNGASPLPKFRLLLGTLGEQTHPWTAIAHLGDLLSQEEAKMVSLLELFAALPRSEETDTSQTAGILSDQAWTQDLMTTLETDALAVAMTTSSESDEGALPFAARLVTNGTLDSLLKSLELALQTMR